MLKLGDWLSLSFGEVLSKRIRDPNQKCSSKAECYIPYHPHPTPGSVWISRRSQHQSYWRKHSRFPTWAYRRKQVNTHPTKFQRTKHKEKNAKCALCRSLNFNCWVAGWQDVPRNTGDTKAILVEKYKIRWASSKHLAEAHLAWMEECSVQFWHICEHDIEESHQCEPMSSARKLHQQFLTILYYILLMK